MEKLEIEEVFDRKSLADERKATLEKEYELVKMYPIRYGGKKKSDYHYVVRAYNKINN